MPDAGQVICVLDTLDEDEEVARDITYLSKCQYNRIAPIIQ
jgi:hypothetical protein